MTRSEKFRRITLVAGITALVLITGCAGNKKKDDGGVPTAPSADENVGDSDTNRAMGLQTVHFPYDSATLDAENQSTLKSNAEILKSKADLKIQIEGHCSEEGSIQYNVALGERRANATKKLLQDMGIKGDRMKVISFGKEKPIDTGSSEAARAKNRRANFVIISQ